MLRSRTMLAGPVRADVAQPSRRVASSLAKAITTSGGAGERFVEQCRRQCLAKATCMQTLEDRLQTLRLCNRLADAVHAQFQQGI